MSCSTCTVISLQLAVPHVVNNTETGGEDLMTRDRHRVTFDMSRTRRGVLHMTNISCLVLL